MQRERYRQIARYLVLINLSFIHFFAEVLLLVSNTTVGLYHFVSVRLNMVSFGLL